MLSTLPLAACYRRPLPLQAQSLLLPSPLLPPADQLQIITAFRDAMLARPGQKRWSLALASWTCPTDAANSVGGVCDPCGQEVCSVEG